MSDRINTIYNLLGNLLPLAVAAFFIPYINKGMGADSFGFLTLIWAAIGYFGIFDLGISKALVYHAARTANSDGKISLAPAVNQGAILILAVGAIAMVMVIIFSRYIVLSLLKENLQLEDVMLLAVYYVAITIPFTTFGNALRGVLEGLSCFKEVAILKSITGSMFFLIPAIFIYFGFGRIDTIALALLFSRLIAALWLAMLVYNHPFYQKDVKWHCCTSDSSLLFRYGLWALLSSIISPLMVYGDRFVISTISGAASVGIYAIFQESLGRTVLLSASYSAVLQPKFTDIPNKKDQQPYREKRRILMACMAIFYFFIALFGIKFAELWLSIDLGQYTNLFYIFTLALFFNSLAQLPYSYLLAKGRADIPAKLHLFEFVIYLPLCIFFTMKYGLIGSGASWMARVFVDYCLLEFFAKKCYFN